MIRGAFKRVNERLPPRLRAEKVTGHTGRHTFTSAGVNSGTDVTLVSLASKHKTTSALKRYIHRDESIRVEPALKIAKSVVKNFEENDHDSHFEEEL
jgi:integrase